MTDGTPTLDSTYAVARQRFLEAATAAGAEVDTFPHPLTGREGEGLAIDVAQLGASDAPSALLIVSGTHGVEGYAGSALQSWWLQEHAATAATATVDGVRVVLLHALNSYGFSWVRRVNEDNVDLNRNFVDWAKPPHNPGYGDVAALLVPTEWSDETQAETTNALLERAGEIGLDQFQQVVSGGQYGDATGIFYGGTAPTWSNRWLAEHLPGLVAPAARLGIIDLHTGLGPWGHGELISHERSGDPGYERGTEWWGDVRSMLDGESVSAALTGDWLGSVDGLVPDVEVTSAALEFGTVDTISVLQSLRADAWLHAHGDPTGDDAAAIRAQVRAAFADDDPSWLAALIERFDQVSASALAALAA